MFFFLGGGGGQLGFGLQEGYHSAAEICLWQLKCLQE